MANIIGKNRTAAEVPTPPAGYVVLFTDAATKRPKYKDDTGFVGDYTGPQGVKGDTGATGPAANSFSIVKVGSTNVVADQSDDTLTLAAGAGLSITPDAANDALTFTNTDPGSTARAQHEAAADPHPQYTTQAEAAAAAPVQSVNGLTGAVVVPTKLAATISALFASGANSAAVFPVLTMTVPANYLKPGMTFEFMAMGTQSQAAAAVNVTFLVQVNGTTVAQSAVAGGTAAQTNRPCNFFGSLTWNGSAFIGGCMTTIQGILPAGGQNITGVAANAAANVTITIAAQNSVANAANIIRVASAFITEQ